MAVELCELLNLSAAIERASEFDVIHYQAISWPISLPLRGSRPRRWNKTVITRRAARRFRSRRTTLKRPSSPSRTPRRRCSPDST